MRCKYIGASGSSSKNRSRQKRTESECGGVQNRGKVCLDDTVRRAKGASDKGSVRTGLHEDRVKLIKQEQKWLTRGQEVMTEFILS